MERPTKIKWDESLSVGVEYIDQQHQRLIDIVNKLNYASKIGQGRRVLGQLIHGLGEYTIYHFKAEEELMREAKYPGLDQQQTDHQWFIKQLLELDERYKKQDVLITAEILSFLKNWIFNHIISKDKELGKHLIQVEKKEPDDPENLIPDEPKIIDLSVNQDEKVASVDPE